MLVSWVSESENGSKSVSSGVEWEVEIRETGGVWCVCVCGVGGVCRAK